MTRLLRNGIRQTKLVNAYHANGSRCYCEIYSGEGYALHETADRAYRRLINDERFSEVRFSDRDMKNQVIIYCYW